MAPKSVTFRRHDHLVSVLFEDLLSHSYNITFSMFLDLVLDSIAWFTKEVLRFTTEIWPSFGGRFLNNNVCYLPTKKRP